MNEFCIICGADSETDEDGMCDNCSDAWMVLHHISFEVYRRNSNVSVDKATNTACTNALKKLSEMGWALVE